MFIVNSDLSIYCTRGDIAVICVRAEENGVPYVFKAGDSIRFKVVEKKNYGAVMLQKDFPVESSTEVIELKLTEHDTRIGDLISKPVDYWYEIELNPLTNPQTIIGYDEDGAKVFRLLPEGKTIDISGVEPEDIPIVDKELDATSPRPVQNSVITAAIKQLEEKAGSNADGISGTQKAISDHAENRGNPHGVTKAQIGLGNADNTADMDKPVSTAQVEAIRAAEERSGQSLKAHTDNTENPHGVTKDQVGLGNADNTADIDKPVSTAQAEAIAEAKKAGTDAKAAAEDAQAAADAANAAAVAAQELAKAYTASAVRKAAPVNLLDNSYFRNPVNQSGQTSYSNNFIYTIDRWQTGDSGSAIELQNDGVKLYSSDGSQNFYIFQRVKKMCAGTYTFAAKFHGNTGIAAISSYATDVLGYIAPSSIDESGVLILVFIITEDIDSNFAYFRLQSPSVGSSVVWEWAALYEGEYTAETLPEYHPKGYMVEALNCGALHVTTTATLSTTWSGSGPYTQAVSVAGILASDNPHITPVYSTTNATAIAQKEAWACVSKAVTSANTITFTCFEEKPTTAIPIQIEVNR